MSNIPVIEFLLFISEMTNETSDRHAAPVVAHIYISGWRMHKRDYSFIRLQSKTKIDVEEIKLTVIHGVIYVVYRSALRIIAPPDWNYEKAVPVSHFGVETSRILITRIWC